MQLQHMKAAKRLDNLPPMILLGPIGPQVPKELYAMLAIVLCRTKNIERQRQVSTVAVERCAGASTNAEAHERLARATAVQQQRIVRGN
eukprot:20816-Heterococcus_DN1.PRE.3